MGTSSCRILWTGDAEHHEFRGLLDWLGARAVVSRQSDIARAATFLVDSATPPHDLVIVAQSRPGQFPQSSLERLRQAAPLTPIVAALGSWCEGDARSGLPWKGIPRCYWHQLRSQLARGLTTSKSSGTPRWPEWHLPRTITDAERSLHATEQPLPTSGSMTSGLTHPGPMIAPTIWVIRASSVTTFETLADTLRLVQLGSVWWPANRPAPPCRGMHGILWDAEELDDFEWSRLGDHFQAANSLPVIVLVGFLRRHEQIRLIACGVTSVVTKPLWIENLLHELLHARNRQNEVPFRTLPDHRASQGSSNTG